MGAPCRNRAPYRRSVGDCGLVSRLDTSPCFLLPVLHVEEQMGRLYFGNVKFLFGWRFPDSGVALMGVLVSGRLASGGSPSLARLTVGMCCLNTAQWEPAGGIPSGRRRGVFPERHPSRRWVMKLRHLRVTQSNNPSSGIAGASSTRRLIGLPHWSVTGGNRLKGTKLASAGASDTRNDPAQALPQRLLDPVGVWNGLDGDNSLGHGHPTDLGVVITQAGEDRGHYLPGLVQSHEPAQ